MDIKNILGIPQDVVGDGHHRNVVLVVDDDRDIVEAICINLKGHLPDVELVTAYDGNEAVDVYLEKKPWVVVLDLMLPKRGGFLVLQKMKGRSQLVDVAPFVIMITSNDGVRHQRFAESLGAWQYLHKPFLLDSLFEKVQEGLHRG